MKVNRKRLLCGLSVLLLLSLTTLGIPMARAALDQSDEMAVQIAAAQTYGSDPGRDELMGTGDDLCYLDVLSSAASEGISILTVNYGATLGEENLKTIAGMTGGVYYNRTATPNWNSSVLSQIVGRIGSGKGDVAFVLDLSGSMGGATLAEVKNKTAWIINNLPVGLDIGLGVGSFVDYPHSYNSCGYAAVYGTAATGDYAWKFDQQITSDRAAAKSVIGALETRYGSDTAEDYARAVFESQFFMWRFQAKKIVVLIGDAPAHSCCTPPVGGTVMPVNIVELLGSHLGFASVSAAAAISAAAYAGYRKRKND